MKIIGHRGAAGLALENTLPSLELARLLGVGAIEFDLRKTKDNILVLCHDSDLSRISTSSAKIAEITLKELQKITLSDGQSKVPTLEEALNMTGKTPLIMDVKQKGCSEELKKILKNFANLDITIASFKLDELERLRSIGLNIKLVGLERTKPFDIIHFATQRNLDGVGLNFWLLNPLTYFLIKRRNLSIFVYTVNNRLIGRIIALLYPEVAICTNHPEWFIKHPWLRLRKSAKNNSTRSTGRNKLD